MVYTDKVCVASEKLCVKEFSFLSVTTGNAYFNELGGAIGYGPLGTHTILDQLVKQGNIKGKIYEFTNDEVEQF